MSLSRIVFGLLPLAAWAGDPALDAALKAVETRYNQARTLEVTFFEQYTPSGRPKRSEAGRLRLSKPGKMRWDYTQPAGKLFISDGKYLWLYVPSDNRAEKMKLKESEDMRAPLAFLLGKLKFQKEFRSLTGTREGDGWRIVGEPRSEALPYSRVEFQVAADARIREVKVAGFDKSVLEFRFEDERVNPPLGSKLFEYKPPPGVQVMEAAQ